ncbi:TPA: aspartate-semialdehyde dehydrogenase [Candidatus Poribacteria bacterium]|nr:aspartate-semialdehyde dehydrogenase [Candidatus Poribacteria bacterium]
MALRITVVGVGMVGEQIVSILRERNFPMEWPPRVCATRERSEVLAGENLLVEETSEDSFKGADFVFFAGREGAEGASVTWRSVAEAEGAICVDNGSDFRMDPNVPLVVPEVNLDAIGPENKFIASPNCSTIQMVITLHPLHRVAKIRRVIVSTYQSVSGWGVRANEQLIEQTPKALEDLDDIPFDPTVLARPIAFNYIPHIASFTEDGYTKEEMKMVKETQKIMGDESIRITATTVRVPAFVGHGESINIETEKKLTADEAREILSKSPGIVVLDELNPENPRNDPLERIYPTALDIRKYRDEVLVGRIRQDKTIENGLNLWCVADNLRKGAALNVVQIGEGLIAKGMVKL